MATLRLFAQVREAAGTASVEVDAGTVGAVIDSATDTFGEAFAALVSICQIWVNGEPAVESDPVAAGDEVALLPPVSGG